MSTSNYAFRYVGYPTAVLAKSCKLIPTMVMSIFIERKRYSLQEWVAAGCITTGIVLFNLSRISSVPDEKQDSLHGLILLIISLAMDGFLGSCQGLLKRSDVKGTRRPPTAMETMLYVNLYALVWIIPMAIQTGEWTEGMSRLDEIKHGMILLNAAAASGQIFIFLTLTWFSPLVCTTITTTRKFFHDTNLGTTLWACLQRDTMECYWFGFWRFVCRNCQTGPEASPRRKSSRCPLYPTPYNEFMLSIALRLPPTASVIRKCCINYSALHVVWWNHLSNTKGFSFATSLRL
jgi:hypothetical protein